MKDNLDDSWISFSDIMTVLMMIFLFISISYMIEVKKEQEQRNQILTEFKSTKNKLYKELSFVFESDFEKWKVKINEDLSIKFTNPEVLFKSGKTEIREEFKIILNKFLPKYFDIILKEEYQNKISEIRIEGHTDSMPAPKYDKDPYIANLLLSQKRSSEVIKYFRKMNYFRNLPSEKIKIIEFLLTANGLSYGRTVDDDNNLTIVTNNTTNNEKSRRVEFRIITTASSIIDDVLNKL